MLQNTAGLKRVTSEKSVEAPDDGGGHPGIPDGLGIGADVGRKGSDLRPSAVHRGTVMLGIENRGFDDVPNVTIPTSLSYAISQWC